MTTISNFILNKQKFQNDFLKYYIDLFESNESLFLIFYPVFIAFPDKNELRIEDIIETVNICTEGKWVQIFDEKFKGFSKVNLWEKISHTKEDFIIYDANINLIKKRLVTDFLKNQKNLSVYNKLSTFEPLRELDNFLFRNFLYSEEFSKQNNVNYKPLNIENWIKYYIDIANVFFLDFIIVKNNLDSITYSRNVNEDINLNIIIHKKEIRSNLKTDKLIYPYIEYTLSDNHNIHQKVAIFTPHSERNITDSNNEVDYIKKLTFFSLYHYFYINRKIIDFLIH